MEFTATMRKAIHAGLQDCIEGFSPLAEVGLREGENGRDTVNALNWRADADLSDMIRLRDLRLIDDCPDLPGAATLDLYVTAGRFPERQLECNVYVTIKNGVVADVHNRTLDADARCIALLGRPWSKDFGM